MPYQVINAETNEAYVSAWSGGVLVIASANQANELARDLTQNRPGTKWRIKRVADTSWHDRERQKFDEGTYTYLPWMNERWWDYNGCIHQYHFAHVSRSEPGKIAYTESAEKGMDNIQTQIKPGRYLEKYFGEIAAKWDLNIHGIAIKFANMYEPKPLHFAITEDEIQNIYERGPKSCMSAERYRAEHGWGWSGVPGAWPLDTHACRVYAAGDLQVAYLLANDENPKSEVIARSLIWPAKKTHSRCYGNDSRMQASLTAAGYHARAPLGAKLLRIPIGDIGKFVCPYIDAGMKSGHGSLAVKDTGDHLIICKPDVGTYTAGTTNGGSSGRIGNSGRETNPEEFHCVRCDSHGVDTWRVYHDSSSSFERWCADCREDGRTYACSHDSRYYDTDRMPSVVMADGGRWSQRAFNAAGFTCQGSGGRWPRTERVTMADGTLWCLRHYRSHGFQCRHDGQQYPRTEAVMMADGFMISAKAYAIVGFNCPGCGKNEYTSRRGIAEHVCSKCVEKKSSPPASKQVLLPDGTYTSQAPPAPAGSEGEPSLAPRIDPSGLTVEQIAELTLQNYLDQYMVPVRMVSAADLSATEIQARQRETPLPPLPEPFYMEDEDDDDDAHYNEDNEEE